MQTLIGIAVIDANLSFPDLSSENPTVRHFRTNWFTHYGKSIFRNFSLSSFTQPDKYNLINL